MRISDWSSDVCSSDLAPTPVEFGNGYLFAYAGPDPDDPQPGEVVRGDILRIGGGSNYQAKGQKGWGIQNDFTYTGIEGHPIKAGHKSKWVELNSLQLNNLNPVYTYNEAFQTDRASCQEKVVLYV